MLPLMPPTSEQSHLAGPQVFGAPLRNGTVLEPWTWGRAGAGIPTGVCALQPVTHSACLGTPCSWSTQHGPDTTARDWSHAPHTPELSPQARPEGATSGLGCSRGAGDGTWGALGSSSSALRRAAACCSCHRGDGRSSAGRPGLLERRTEDRELGYRFARARGCWLHGAALCQSRLVTAYKGLPHQGPLLQLQVLEKPLARQAEC